MEEFPCDFGLGCMDCYYYWYDLCVFAGRYRKTKSYLTLRFPPFRK